MQPLYSGLLMPDLKPVGEALRRPANLKTHHCHSGRKAMQGQAQFYRVEMPWRPTSAPPSTCVATRSRSPGRVLEEMAGPPTHENRHEDVFGQQGLTAAEGAGDVGEDRFRAQERVGPWMSTARVSRWDQLGAAAALPAGPVVRPVMARARAIRPARSTRLLRRTGRTNHRGVGDGVPR